MLCNRCSNPLIALGTRIREMGGRLDRRQWVDNIKNMFGLIQSSAFPSRTGTLWESEWNHWLAQIKLTLDRYDKGNWSSDPHHTKRIVTPPTNVISRRQWPQNQRSWKIEHTRSCFQGVCVCSLKITGKFLFVTNRVKKLADRPRFLSKQPWYYTKKKCTFRQKTNTSAAYGKQKLQCPLWPDFPVHRIPAALMSRTLAFLLSAGAFACDIIAIVNWSISVFVLLPQFLFLFFFFCKANRRHVFGCSSSSSFLLRIAVRQRVI